jgi:uncharacterized protein
LNQTLAQTYLPDQFTHDIYPALVPVEETVPTLAVGDVMAVFAWQPHTERYNKVALFVDDSSASSINSCSRHDIRSGVK